MCFHTKDAVRRAEGSFTFDMPLGSLRTHANKVALASCEFPMVQWTVEPEWCRVHYSETLRKLPPAGGDLRVSFSKEAAGRDGRVPPAERRTVPLYLPQRLNPATLSLSTSSSSSSSTTSRSIDVRCASPHRLFTSNRLLLNSRRAVGRLVSLETSDLALSDCDVIEFVDDRVFRMVFSSSSEALGQLVGNGMLYLPVATSPLALAQCLTEEALLSDVPLDFVYDDPTDRIVPRVRMAGSVRVRVCFERTMLASILGLSTEEFSSEASRTQLPCTSGRWFDSFDIACGFYAPCHRPMGTGQPNRIGQEIEGAFNRFYFPMTTSSDDASSASRHLVIFSTPSGDIVSATVLPGRYSAKSLATSLQTAMTAASNAGFASTPASAGSSSSGDGASRTTAPVEGEVLFSVRVTDDGRFVFSCEIYDRSRWRDAPFSLLFHHPLSIDAGRMGFPQTLLSGCSSYTSRDRVATTTTPPRNLVRIGDMSSQKRFRFQAVPIPTLLAVVVADTRPSFSESLDRPGERILTLRTYVNHLPFCSGLRPGDLVRMSPSEEENVTDTLASGERTSVRARATPETWRGIRSRVVVESPPSMRDDPSLFSMQWSERLMSRMGDMTGSCLQVVTDVEPWNLHFGKPEGIKPHMLGFQTSAVLWGRDGVNGGMPPYESPNVHDLDHPDYVCMTFSESRGAGLEHTYGESTRFIFCKLSLYPLFREERMLPRDTELANGNVSSFTISFWNPDMTTPYHFHGAEFSFSLAFFSSIPA